MYFKAPVKISGYKKRTQQALRKKIHAERFSLTPPPMLGRKEKIASLKQLSETKSFQRDLNRMKSWINPGQSIVEFPTLNKPGKEFERTKKKGSIFDEDRRIL